MSKFEYDDIRGSSGSCGFGKSSSGSGSGGGGGGDNNKGGSSSSSGGSGHKKNEFDDNYIPHITHLGNGNI